ncbi:MAG TPA: GNAT family protein [Kineosporiaceae bacterium]|nr:GNAT family protein [Kineosporiaceae bacterium]
MNSLSWPDTPPRLTDGTVTLRVWNEGDVEAILAACQDHDIQRWTRVPVPYLLDHATGLVRHYAPQLWQSRQGMSLAVAASDGDELLGSCGLVAVDAENLVGEVGYWLAPWARGRKMAQRAVGLLCQWAVTDGGLARLELYVEPGNGPSRAVAEKLGCTFEGLLRSKTLLHGVRRDLALYAFLPAG